MTAPSGELLVHYRHGSSGYGWEKAGEIKSSNDWKDYLDE